MINEQEQQLRIWAVMKDPSDYPNKYIARLFHSGVAQDCLMISGDLEPLQDIMVQMGLVKLTRSEDDEAQHVETWI